MLRGDLAVLVEMAAERIEIRRYQAAGCYGRNCADDVCADALLLSRAVRQPVRVQLTRAQEHLWEPKGAAQLMEVQGGLKSGDLHAYAIDTWYPSNRGPNLGLLLTGRISPEPRPSDMGDRTIIPPYRVPHKDVTVPRHGANRARRLDARRVSPAPIRLRMKVSSMKWRMRREKIRSPSA